MRGENKIIDLKLSIYESCYQNQLSISDRDTLLEKLDDKIYMESLKDIGNKLADKYNSGINKRSTTVASKIVKDPTHGGRKYVSTEIYDQYKRDMLKWRTRYKVGEILVTGAIMIKPLDILIQTAIASAMRRSTDPVDKSAIELMDKLKERALQLKDKLTSLVSRVKKKKISEKELSSQINSLDTAGCALAKQTDHVRSIRFKGKYKIKPREVKESAYEKIDRILMEGNHLTDKSYKILNMVIENTDFDEVDMLPLVFHYTVESENVVGDMMPTHQLKFVTNDVRCDGKLELLEDKKYAIC